MANTPRPNGWVGSGSDGTIVRTLDGHLGVNVETDPELAADIDWRRNAKSFDEADLGSESYDVSLGRKDSTIDSNY